MNIYYVYFYLRSKDSNTAKAGTPYYVGKGKNRRAYDTHYQIPVPKDKSKIILVEQELTELQAFILERYYIRWFGRKDNKTGILLNMTNGGDGVSGYKFPKNAKEERNIKISKANSGKKRKKEQRLNLSKAIKGVKKSPFTEQHKLNMSKAKLGNDYSKGKTVSDETKKKSSISNRNRLTVVNINGNCIKMRIEDYEIQKQGEENNWEWVSINTKIGKIRLGKSLLEIKEYNNTISNRQKCMVPCYDRQGTYILIDQQNFHSQTGPKEHWEWVHNKSKEGKIRKLIRLGTNNS